VATQEADTLIIGSGVAGTTVARELVEAGQRVTIVERGGLMSWQDQMDKFERSLPQPDHDAWESASPTAVHNHEVDPDGVFWPWTYIYGVGGSTNRWAGTSPVFLPEDFEMQSRFGVMRDWPISYEDLLPDYNRAMEVMAVSGGENDLMPGAKFALPAHPFSPQDEAVAPYLQPFIPLPQSRPSKAVDGVPACCHSGRCQLCPVNARFSVLNRLGWVFDRPEVELLINTIASRLISDASGRRIDAVECVDRDGFRFQIKAKRVVVAANGIESAGLMLRSGLDHGDTGLHLFDHRNAKVVFRTKANVKPGRGYSLVTGASYLYYTGDFRRERAATLLLPFNPGPPRKILFDGIVDGLASGRSGRTLRREVVDRWERTVAMDMYIDDVPDRNNRVTLSSERDSFGIPRNKVRWSEPTEYLNKAVAHIVEDLPRRLRGLGAFDANFEPFPIGAHLLGTLRMGTDPDAVVDPDLRHHRRENLWVSGGAVMPTYSPAHPTLTIGALGTRLGRHLAEEV